MRKRNSKHFSQEQKRVAVELFKAKVPRKCIRKQLQMSQHILRHILSHAKSHPDSPVIARKSGTGLARKITPETEKKMEKLLNRDPCLTGKQLKKKIPALGYVGIRRFQQVCTNKLKLPSRKMAKKPLLSQRMKDQRLEFTMEYRDWTVE
jgi:hypothetical protein